MFILLRKYFGVGTLFIIAPSFLFYAYSQESDTVIRPDSEKASIELDERYNLTTETEDDEIMHPFSIGLSFSVPQVAGIDLAYRFPFLDDAFELFVSGLYMKPLFYQVDGSDGKKTFNLSNSNNGKEVSFSFFSMRTGINYYPFKSAKYFYITAGYGFASLDISEFDAHDLINPKAPTGTSLTILAKGHSTLHSFRAGLGIKTLGRFYFNLEAGFSSYPYSSKLSVDGNLKSTLISSGETINMAFKGINIIIPASYRIPAYAVIGFGFRFF